MNAERTTSPLPPEQTDAIRDGSPDRDRDRETAIEKTARARKRAGRAGAFFFFAFFLSILDAGVAELREPANVLHVLPGAVVPVNGMLEHKTDAGMLSYGSGSGSITVSFDGLQTGFWLGGNLWLGTVFVGPHIRPGAYDLKIFVRGTPSSKPAAVFTVRVHKDYAGYRRSFTSVIRRQLGISPWVSALLFLPFAGASLAAVFFVSRRLEELLARQGRAEVYLIRKSGAGTEITFGLGTKHGVGPGTRLLLSDPEGRAVQTLEVLSASPESAMAIVGPEHGNVRPGFIVSLIQGP